MKLLALTLLLGSVLASTACCTTKRYHYEEDTVQYGENPKEGDRRPAGTQSGKSASDPEIIVE